MKKSEILEIIESHCNACSYQKTSACLYSCEFSKIREEVNRLKPKGKWPTNKAKQKSE